MDESTDVFSLPISPVNVLPMMPDDQLAELAESINALGRSVGKSRVGFGDWEMLVSWRGGPILLIVPCHYAGVVSAE